MDATEYGRLERDELEYIDLFDIAQVALTLNADLHFITFGFHHHERNQSNAG